MRPRLLTRKRVGLEWVLLFVLFLTLRPFPHFSSLLRFLFLFLGGQTEEAAPPSSAGDENVPTVTALIAADIEFTEEDMMVDEAPKKLRTETDEVGGGT